MDSADSSMFDSQETILQELHDVHNVIHEETERSANIKKKLSEAYKKL